MFSNTAAPVSCKSSRRLPLRQQNPLAPVSLREQLLAADLQYFINHMSYGRLQQHFNDPRAHSSAVASVFCSRGTDEHETTKSGSDVYHGHAATYHEWEFRTRLRVKGSGTDPERYAEVMSKVVDGPRGDAFIIAKEVGLDNLWDAGDEYADPGVDVLINAIEAGVFPLTTYEATELFRQYCKPSGSLSRQTG